MARLTWRRNGWYYRRWVPTRYRDVERRREIVLALDTDSRAVAERKSKEIDVELARYWAALSAGDDGDARRRHQAIADIASAHGFGYRSSEELASGEVAELYQRIRYLEARGLKGDKRAVEAIVAGAAAPPFALSEVLPFYWSHTRDRVREKSEEQLRRWRNPREKCMRDFQSVVGDVALEGLERTHLLDYRTALLEQVLEGEISAETANKYLSYLTGVLRTVCEARGLATPNTQRLALATGAARHRSPYSVAFIRDHILGRGRLDALNAPARNVVHAMIETGMRPSEVVNIAPENIVLDAEIPHVRIRRVPGRDLKTPGSERDVPLVGVSLHAFRDQASGWPEYRDREASLSATVNKFLRLNGLRPEPGLSLYSLRHSFEDRMIASGADERMRVELMGHAYGRPKYGQGPTLRAKRELLQQMAIAL